MSALAATALALVGLSACNGDAKSRAADSASTVVMLPPVVMRPPAPGDSSCPRNGLWQPCALVDRIVHAGLSFKPIEDSVRVEFFPMAGAQYRVALKDTMIVFFFADSTALTKAMASLDTIRMVPKQPATTDTTLAAAASPWPFQPTVIRSGNMLALYFASSERQIERVKLAISAGAPY